MKIKIFLLSVLILGACGVIGHFILLREFLNILSGNELTIGMLFAHWLIVEALGVFLCNKLIEKVKNKIQFLTTFHILFFLLLILQVYLIRNLKNILGFSISETIPLLPAFFSTLALITPSAFIHGTAFASSCNLSTYFLSAEKSNENIYTIETLGSILGATAWSIWLVKFSNTFTLIFSLFALKFFILIILIKSFSEDKLFAVTKKFTISCLFVFLALILSIVFNLPSLIHQSSIKRQWKGQNIVEYKNSKFNNICVVENQNQYIFFLNGTPTASLPIPDTIYIEEFVNIPLFIHPAPEQILIIGNGFAGLLEEISKHKNVKTIDYAEPDPILIEIALKYSDKLGLCEFRNPKINISTSDGLHFLKNTDKKYDVILLGIHEPSNLQSNRFFTENFFSTVKQKLNTQGIIAMAIPGSFSKITDEIKKINACIYSTLKSVFTYVRPLPADGKNIFLASQSEIICIKKEKFIANITERFPFSENIAIPKHIEQRLHPHLQTWFYNLISEINPSLNTITKPSAVFYTISGWNRTFASGLHPLFLFFEHNPFLKLSLISTIPLIIAFYLLSVAKNASKENYKTISLTIAVNGFFSTSIYLTSIFLLQSILGNIIELIGILSAAFLFGNAIGAFLCISFISKFFFKKIHFFIISEILYLCLCIIMLFLLINLSTISNATNDTLSSFIFSSVCLITGSLSGFQFSTANQLYLDNKFTHITSASIPYASDLFGAWFGSLTLSIVFFPLLGLINTFTILLIIKFFCFIFNYRVANKH